jgi:hypothetical protein
MASSVPASSSLDVQIGDIYLIFDKENPGKLKAMGKMKDAKQMAEPVKEVSGEVATIKADPKIKQRISSNLNRKFEKGYSVIVKLEHDNKFLYIPGFVVDIEVAGDGSMRYKIGVAKDKTITGVQQNQIARNDALEPANPPNPPNNEGWFFSDVVLGSLLDGNNTELDYKAYAAKMDDIITNANGVRKITVQSLTSSPDAIKKASETSPATTADQDSYQLTDPIELNNNEIEKVKMKSVVPLSFNAADVSGEKIAPSSATTVFGGKKSRKQNTRKNTMPLQFAPGAKRSYLKRRKSSRK